MDALNARISGKATNLVPVRDVTVSLKGCCKRLFLAPDMTPLDVRMEGEYAVATVPRFDTHALVVAEWA